MRPDDEIASHESLPPGRAQEARPLPDGQRLVSVTVKVDRRALYRARFRALVEGTTVSGLMRAWLSEYASDENWQALFGRRG